MVLVNKTFEVVTQESAELGDAEKRGFVFEDVAYSFSDLVSEMKMYCETSSYPPRPSDWLTSSPDHDYKTGAETSYSLHYSRGNKDRSAKYWEKAMRKAGLLK